jgi:hypothetical protein
MNARHDSSKVLSLIHQAGALGASAPEIAAWTGMALGVVETHLRTPRRRDQIVRSKATRLNAPVYLERPA